MSVIVPTKNERENLPSFLESVPDDVEVILCDASDDGTPDLARVLRPRNLEVVAGQGSIAHARNQGASYAHGDLLIFTDADVQFGAGYWRLPRGTPPWDGLFGPKLSQGQFAEYYRSVASGQANMWQLFGIAVASGSNMIIRREVFHELGGFRPRLPCNEDTELFLRAGRLGYDIHFDEQLVVWATDHRRLARGVTRKSLHSLSRSLLLYATCRRVRLPRILRHDWSYWSSARVQEAR
ncbi:MAG: glycosyltransferase [Chloroflexota bacterium]